MQHMARDATDYKMKTLECSRKALAMMLASRLKTRRPIFGVALTPPSWQTLQTTHQLN
jgi:hypothetical protein